MGWEKIIGQERVKKILQKALNDNQIAHAYCFWGIEGIGKDALAIEFAKTLNCRNPIKVNSSISACGKCISCKQAETLQNPNIQLIFSLPPGKSTDTKNDSPYSKLSDEQIDEIKEALQKKSVDYYSKIQLANANQIKIASIREIRKNLSLSAVQQGRRCFIIIRADEMTNEASNAFLKSLEEPSDNVCIILTTSRHESLLPTLLSRCQQIHCSPLSDQDIIKFLLNNNNISLTEAKIVAAFAQGSVTRAIEYLDGDLKSFREDVVDTLRNALKKRIYRQVLSQSIDKILSNKDKRKLEVFLNLLLFWLRDAYFVSKLSNFDDIINVDKIEIINKFAAGFNKKDFKKAIDLVDNSILLIRKNVQPQLIFINLFIQLRNIFIK